MSDTDKYKVLVVDDSPQDLQIALEFLKEAFTVVVATSGEKAIEIAKIEPMPDVILMDVTMPGMNGYEACSVVLNNNPNHNVIFVSANDATSEILKGYDAGGIDYVTKPYSEDVLLSKIERAIHSGETEKKLSQQSQMASETAMTAMRSAGELSTVVQFLRESFVVGKAFDLAELTVGAIQGYDLIAAVQLRSANETVNYCSAGRVSSLESELLGRMQHHSEKILEAGRRLFVNYKNVTILIRNLPEKDPDLVGRLRDNLMIIAEGASYKLEAIDLMLDSSLKRKTGIKSVVADVELILRNFLEEQEEQKKSSVKVLHITIEKIESSFLSLGLTEEQQQQIISILHSGVEELLSHFESGVDLDEKLKEVISRLLILEE
jgi:CheY-like chemotaxis protein